MKKKLISEVLNLYINIYLFLHFFIKVSFNMYLSINAYVILSSPYSRTYKLAGDKFHIKQQFLCYHNLMRTASISIPVGIETSRRYLVVMLCNGFKQFLHSDSTSVEKSKQALYPFLKHFACCISQNYNHNRFSTNVPGIQKLKNKIKKNLKNSAGGISFI